MKKWTIDIFNFSNGIKILEKMINYFKDKNKKPNRNIKFIKFYLQNQKIFYTFVTIPTASTFIPLSVTGIIFLDIPNPAGVA